MFITSARFVDGGDDLMETMQYTYEQPGRELASNNDIRSRRTIDTKMNKSLTSYCEILVSMDIEQTSKNNHCFKIGKIKTRRLRIHIERLIIED